MCGCSLLSEKIIQWSGSSLFAEGKSFLTLTEWDRVGRGEVVLERVCVCVCWEGGGNQICRWKWGQLVQNIYEG